MTPGTLLTILEIVFIDFSYNYTGKPLKNRKTENLVWLH